MAAKCTQFENVANHQPSDEFFKHICGIPCYTQRVRILCGCIVSSVEARPKMGWMCKGSMCLCAIVAIVAFVTVTLNARTL